MKAASVILVLIALVGCARAQGNQPDRSFCEGVRDYGCSAILDLSSRDSCTSRHFTPPCDGWYSLTAKAECNSPYHCYACLATVNVYDGDQWLVNCHTSSCFFSHICEETCSGQGAGVYLTGHHEYVLWVGLRPCTGSQCGTGAINDCDHDHCSAVGYVISSGNPKCPDR
jgi:hypothetical protein